MKKVLFVFVTISLFSFISINSLEKRKNSLNDRDDIENIGLDTIKYDNAKRLIKNFNNNSPFPKQINGFYIPKSFLKDIPNKNNDEGIEFIFGVTKNGITLIMMPARYNSGHPIFDSTNAWSSSAKNPKNFRELTNNVIFIKKKDNNILLENSKNNYEKIYATESTQMRSFFVGKKLLHKILYPDNKSIRTGIKVFLAKFNSSSKNINAIFQANDNEKSPYILKKSSDFQIYSCIYESFPGNSNVENVETIKPCPKYCGN